MVVIWRINILSSLVFLSLISYWACASAETNKKAQNPGTLWIWSPEVTPGAEARGDGWRVICRGRWKVTGMARKGRDDSRDRETTQRKQLLRSEKDLPVNTDPDDNNS